jgi:hypothetical protein
MRLVFFCKVVAHWVTTSLLENLLFSDKSNICSPELSWSAWPNVMSPS